MPVASEISRVQYVGNGSTTTPYGVPFNFLGNADIRVVLADAAGAEVLLVETSHYTLTGAGHPAGGSLTTTMAYDGAHTLTIYREPQQTQSADFQSTGALPADTLTRGLDKLTMLVQSLGRKLGRCFRLNDKAADVDALSEASRANTVFGFDSDGNPVLRDRAVMLSLLSLEGSLQGAPTAFWADDGERALKVPDFTGQLGVQFDTFALYRSIGSGAGAWSLLLLDEDSMSSNSAVRSPSQQSVKAYVDVQVSAAVASATATSAAAASAGLMAYLPPGSVIPFAGSSAPGGWLLCYGQAVSRTTYAGLFTTISTTYGAGDGSTTFNLPDLRGRTVAGVDNMGGSAASRITNSGTGNPGINGSSLGAAGGVQTHTLTYAQMPSHQHAYIRPSTSVWSLAGGGLGGFASGVLAEATTAAGGSEAHPIVQPTMMLNYIIRT